MAKRTFYQSLTVLCFALLLSSCGYVDETITNAVPELKPGILTMPIIPVYLGVNNSYLLAQGPCQSYNMISFTYYSALTTTTTLTGTCVNGSLTAHLPVASGRTAQVFSIAVVGHYSGPTSTSVPPNMTVIYSPPSSPSGFAITSGGGVMSGAGISIVNNSIGEVFVGTQTAVTSVMRNGLQGAIDP